MSFQNDAMAIHLLLSSWLPQNTNEVYLSWHVTLYQIAYDDMVLAYRICVKVWVQASPVSSVESNITQNKLLTRLIGMLKQYHFPHHLRLQSEPIYTLQCVLNVQD